MRTSVFTRLATVGLATMAAFALIPPATGQTPVSGGHFRRALSNDPANLDPALTSAPRRDITPGMDRFIGRALAGCGFPQLHNAARQPQ